MTPFAPSSSTEGAADPEQDPPYGETLENFCFSSGPAQLLKLNTLRNTIKPSQYKSLEDYISALQKIWIEFEYVGYPHPEYVKSPISLTRAAPTTAPGPTATALALTRSPTASTLPQSRRASWRRLRPTTSHTTTKTSSTRRSTATGTAPTTSLTRRVLQARTRTTAAATVAAKMASVLTKATSPRIVGGSIRRRSLTGQNNERRSDQIEKSRMRLTTLILLLLLPTLRPLQLLQLRLLRLLRLQRELFFPCLPTASAFKLKRSQSTQFSHHFNLQTFITGSFSLFVPTQSHGSPSYNQSHQLSFYLSNIAHHILLKLVPQPFFQRRQSFYFSPNSQFPSS